MVGVLHCSIDWIRLKTHQMTPPTILRCCPSFGLNLKSIGQRNWTLEVRAVHGVVRGLHSSSDWISLKTHQMTRPSVLCRCPSFGLDRFIISFIHMPCLLSVFA